MADFPPGMSISAVSALLDIPIPTIRSWERRYGLPVPARTGGKHRRFTMTEVVQLRELRDEIAKGRRAMDAVLAVKSKAFKAMPGGDHVATILDAALGFDVETIRSTLEHALETMGVEKVIQFVTLPVLRDIGTMWEAGRCDVANEHIASQEIRAWMNAHLARAKRGQRKDHLVLATGPKDQHTLGLEGFYLILTHRGWNCRVLGAQTPTASLLRTIEHSRPRGVVVTSHMNLARRSAVESINVARAEGVATFFAGNAFASTKHREGVGAIYLAEDLPAAADRLEAALAS